MAQYIALYILLGLLITICFEFMITRFDIDDVTNTDRVVSIVLWPVLLIAFIYTIIREVFKHFIKKS
jgi:hypothetical protein